MSNAKVLKVMDPYVHNADVEDVLSIIQTPQTEGRPSLFSRLL